jgi:predicted GH43/DUF377 family glycosyl hydrolase
MAGHSRQPHAPLLRRFANNPLLEARADHAWESRHVLNAAAIHLGGKVHLLYRAIGDEGLSVLGHAAAADGMHFGEREDEPAYRSPCASHPPADAGMAPPHASGGSWHGCEDPRLTRLGDRIYMTYTDFCGWESPPAMALTSIAVEDFLAGCWDWTPAHIISPPGECHKNWVIFPATFGGKYAILHSLTPDIQVAYVDSLDELSPGVIKSRYFPSGYEAGWDNWTRGVGAPPVETSAGWLLLYHAMDRRDPDRYKLGALLLDREDPTRVLARLPYPLLEPNARYENDGFKAGVVYNCGTALLGDRLLVYYGGADSVVCGAEINLQDLLQGLLHPASARLGTENGFAEKKG